MTKKEFKEKCSFHTYTGHGIRINAIFFDWKTGYENDKFFAGFKYMVKANVENLTKNKLFDLMYEWIISKSNTQLPWYVGYKYASSNDFRFKVPLGGM
jgi:hypothetical protein